MYIVINIILVAYPCIMLNKILSSELWALSFELWVLLIFFLFNTIEIQYPKWLLYFVYS